MEKSRAVSDAEAAFRDLYSKCAEGQLSGREYLEARFDAGLAWPWAPPECGGRGLLGFDQRHLDAEASSKGCVDPWLLNPLGMGPVASAVIRYGTAAQHERWLRPLFLGDEVWCQLFSEPDAGSDLGQIRTTARRVGEEWIIDGGKVWSSGATSAAWGLVLARTLDPDGRAGMTCFAVEMRTQGVCVRGVRQMTGGTGFAEVEFREVRVPDANRVGREGGALPVMLAALEGERRAMGARDLYDLVDLLDDWRAAGQRRSDPLLRDEVVKAWVAAQVHVLPWSGSLRAALPSMRGGEDALVRKVRAGRVSKIVAHARSRVAGMDAQIVDYEGVVGSISRRHRPVGESVLQAPADTIAGGTAEILLTVIAERILGLPG